MERARSSRRRVFKVQRACERSRVHDELMVVAYELAAPLVRRRLSVPEEHSVIGYGHPSTPQSPLALGGISA
jgi:hypothetical protein